jgi:hypothetical protein
VISTPHSRTEELQSDDQLVLLVSDGVTDVLTDSAMVEVALAALNQVGKRYHDAINATASLTLDIDTLSWQMLFFKAATFVLPVGSICSADFECNVGCCSNLLLCGTDQGRADGSGGHQLAQAIASAVVENAKQRGSKDDITAVSMLLEWE